MRLPLPLQRKSCGERCRRCWRPIRHVLSRLERQTRARQDMPDRTPDVTRLSAFSRKAGKGRTAPGGRPLELKQHCGEKCTGSWAKAACRIGRPGLSVRGRSISDFGIRMHKKADVRVGSLSARNGLQRPATDSRKRSFLVRFQTTCVGRFPSPDQSSQQSSDDQAWTSGSPSLPLAQSTFGRSSNDAATLTECRENREIWTRMRSFMRGRDMPQ